MMTAILFIAPMLGLQTAVDATMIADGAAAAGTANLLFTRGTLQVRPGREQFTILPTNGSPARTLFEYANPADPLATSRLAAVMGTNLYVSRTVARGATVWEQYLSTLDAGADVRLAQFKQSIYLLDGKNPVRKLLNLAAWRTAPTWWPTVQPTPIAQPQADQSTPAHVYYPAFISGSTYNILKYDAEGALQATISNANLTDIIRAIPDGNGNLYCLRHTNGLNAVLKITEAGATVFSFCPHGSGDGQWQDVVGFGFCQANRRFYILDYTSRKVLVYNEGGAYQFSFGGLGSAEGKFSMPTSIGVTDQYVFVGDETSATISVFNLDGTFVCRWQDMPAMNRTGDIAGMPDGSILCTVNFVNKRIIQYTWDGQRQAVWGSPVDGPSGASNITPYGITVDRSNNFYVLDFSTRKLVKYTRTNADPLAVQTLTDYNKPIHTPALADYTGGSSPYVTVGETYEFVVTYGLQVGGSILETPPCDVTNRTIASATAKGVTLTIDTANETALLTDDLMYIYARGPKLADWRRIAALQYVAGVTSYVYDWDATKAVTSTAAVLMPYVNRPPAGCSLLIEYKGRMIYAKGDTLYISQWDDADRVPLDSILEADPTTGFWTRVGTDGAPITGLGTFGSLLVVFKARGVYVCSGEDANSFSVMPISDRHGCLRHDTIQPVGNLLLWLDAGHVWAWDGQTIQDIGKPIEQRLQQVCAADSGYAPARAFAVFDPERNLYLLTVPATATTSTPASLAFVYDAVSNTWGEWGAQPGGCAVLCRHVAEPGVYGADRCDVAANTRKLYRLLVGSTDADAASPTLPIQWDWYSKLFIMPSPGMLKAVLRMAVDFVTNSGVLDADNQLTLAIRINGLSSDAVSHTCASPSRQRTVVWRPARHRGAAALQLHLSGVSSAPLEIPGITALIGARGRVR